MAIFKMSSFNPCLIWKILFVSLPSMRKDRVYAVTIVICVWLLQPRYWHFILFRRLHSPRSSGRWKKGLHRALTKVEPSKKARFWCPTDEVTLEKKVYGVEKRAKLHRINEWDCRPISKRIIDPNKARRFVELLHTIQQQKIKAANVDLLKATSVSELKKAHQAKATLERYDTSGYLQLLDNVPEPSESRQAKLKEERLSRAAKKK